MTTGKGSDATAGAGVGAEEHWKVVTTAPARGFVDTMIGPVFTFLVIHYLLWLPTAAVAALVTHWWIGGGWTVPVVVGVAALLYTPTLLDGSHRRLNGRAWHWLRRLPMWQWGHQRVNLTVIRTHSLAGIKQVIMGWSPHGILILSRLAMYGGAFEQLFPHLGDSIRALGATPIFFWPGSREISLWLGAVDASPSVANKVLQQGGSLIVYPGGSREIFRTDRRSTETVLEVRERLVWYRRNPTPLSPTASHSHHRTAQLNDRKGFVRLAMKHGVPLVPVVVFNEREAYTRVDIPTPVRNFFMRALRVPLLLFYGACCLMPRRLSPGLGIVFGAPLTVPHEPNVDSHKTEPAIAAAVDAAHAAYVAALTALWHEHKGRFGYGPEQTLVVV